MLTDRLVEANRAIWAAMAAPSFVLGLAHGRLPAPALRARVQQDRVFVLEERRVVAALRAHRLPSRLDGLLADLDGGLEREMDAFTRTATQHGFAPDAEPWPVCLGYTCYLRCAASDGTLEGLTALYAAERAYLDTWTAVATASPADSPYHAWIQNWTGGRVGDVEQAQVAPAVEDRGRLTVTGDVAPASSRPVLRWTNTPGMVTGTRLPSGMMAGLFPPMRTSASPRRRCCRRSRRSPRRAGRAILWSKPQAPRSIRAIFPASRIRRGPRPRSRC